MGMISELKTDIEKHLHRLKSEGIIASDCSFDGVTLERPKNEGHGEMSTNAAIVLARHANAGPRQLAEILVARLRSDERIRSLDIAGPGFVNLTMKPEFWHRVIGSALEDPQHFGQVDQGQGRKVNLEFVSANPTGPLHIGHARGAVFGDALGRLLEFVGYHVVREYYVNDGGGQVDTLARSAYLRYMEAHGRDVVFGADGYGGDYLVAVGEGLKGEFGTALLDRPESEWIDRVRDYSLQHMLGLIKHDLERLGVRMDNFVHEKTLLHYGRIEESIQKLKDLDLIYEGILEPPKGRLPEDWEPRRQTLVKSTNHGDDVDRPIRKSDGSWTYFAPDIAYHFDKISRGFDELINIFGSDHGGYVKRLTAIVKAFGGDKVRFSIKLMQQVNVFQGSEKLKMSKRAGNFVMLDEALDTVGPDVTRFVMLMRKNEATLDFDYHKVQEQSKDNPVFYVQYAHARICSLLARASEAGLEIDDKSLAQADLSHLSAPAHVNFLRRLADWPRTVELASRHREPHRLVFYLIELVSEFHSFWAQGNEQANLRILKKDDVPASMAGLALARTTGIIIALGLGIIGVTPVNRM